MENVIDITEVDDQQTLLEEVQTLTAAIDHAQQELDGNLVDARTAIKRLTLIRNTLADACDAEATPLDGQMELDLN